MNIYAIRIRRNEVYLFLNEETKQTFFLGVGGGRKRKKRKKCNKIRIEEPDRIIVILLFDIIIYLFLQSVLLFLLSNNIKKTDNQK